jgi:acyl-CoA synthetase (AMP-forming)/AMP-acid ligase II
VDPARNLILRVTVGDSLTRAAAILVGATLDSFGCDFALLIAALKQRLDGSKVPKSVIVANALPKTSTGKIQKNRLRDDHKSHYEG